jgi:hypothetical protein
MTADDETGVDATTLQRRLDILRDRRDYVTFQDGN